MDTFANYIQQIDFPTIIVMGMMLWFMKSRIDLKFDKIDQRFEKIDQRFEKIDQRFEKVETRLNEMDKRLVVIETTLHMKDCCLLKDHRIQERVE